MNKVSEAVLVFQFEQKVFGGRLKHLIILEVFFENCLKSRCFQVQSKADAS